MRAFLLGSLAVIALGACAEDDPLEGSEASRRGAGPRAEITRAPDAEDLPAALRDGRTSPREAVAAYRRRIELLDDTGPRLQSVLRVNPDAVSEAERLEQARADGTPPGALFGLPILVKDNIETMDMPTTAGSRALIANDTGRDAPAVARLRAEGAIILGKTNLSEWANFRSSESISGWSAVGGLTRNPHTLARNPCGSSSGSGAAIAAGLAWAALGSETNGSVTCPAAMNGIVGFKPTVGLVSRRHVVPISPSQDTIGPMTASVRDAAMLLTVMAGTDPEDPATAEADERRSDYVAALEGATLEGMRLGVLRFAESGDPRERAVFDEAVRRATEAGAEIVEIAELGDLGTESGDFFLVLKAEFKDSLNAYLADAAPEVTVRTLTDLIAFNEADPKELSLFGQDILVDSDATAGMAGDDYQAALAGVRTATRERGIDRLLAENNVDVLIAPSFGPAFVTDLVRGDIIGGRAGAGWIAAIAGYPHLTVPMGDVHGLPLGLSIMAGKWQDAEVLSIGQAFEDILPPRLVPTFRGSAAEIPDIGSAISRDQ